MNYMKTVITTLILTLLFSIPIFGNDGEYLGEGGIIYPIQESRISLEKEILSFTVKDRVCYVDILFEFNNPDNVESKIKVGFQAPAGRGHEYDENSIQNVISNFNVFANGQLLKYKLKVAECEDCELKEPNEFQFTEYGNDVIVYLFEMSFKPGINKINHSYSFQASSSLLEQTFGYILTTGAKWSGGIIKNLTVNFDFGSNKYFYVKDIFGSNANWAIVGSGKVTNKKLNHYDDDKRRMIRIISGRLQIDVKDFKPLENIDFGIFCENSCIDVGYDYDEFDENNFNELCNLSLHEDKNYSKESLKILRNTIYAQYGYQFKDKEIHDYFSKYEWYIPDPNLTMEQINLTKEEKEFIEEILKREKE